MQFVEILIATVLGIIMFGIGSSLKIDDFTVLFSRKRLIVFGLSLQMIFLPLLAGLISYFAPIPPVFKVGLFIVAICPGGTTSNFISYFIKADVALSLALTCINSILILFTIPLLSTFAIRWMMGVDEVESISIWSTFYNVVFILLGPALLGLAINHYFHKTAKALQKPLQYGNAILLAAFFGIKFLAQGTNGGSGISMNEIMHLLPYCLLLHFSALIISYGLSSRVGIDNKRSTTIAIEVGLQNTALAILVTGTLIGNNEMTKPALVYALFSFITTFLFAYIAIRKREDE